MITVNQTELWSGVRLTALHTSKFKTSMLGVRFLAPLDKDKAPCYAMLPALLRRGTTKYPHMEALSGALDDLYGGAIEPELRIKGESHCVGFVGSFLDDAYAPEGSQILEEATQLLGQLVLNPVLGEDGRFLSEYLTGEKEQLIQSIAAQVNDKRVYAQNRLFQEMFKDEPSGVARLGRMEEAKALTPDSIWQGYQDLLYSAPVELYYCGSAPLEQVEQAFRTAFAGLPVSHQRQFPVWTAELPAPPEIRYVEEQLDVTQGKLSMGFRTQVGAGDDTYPALLVFNAIFGGTTTSRLFMHVRERLSLCYYASSGLMKYKGAMLVSSGVEFHQFEAARDEILRQLQLCKDGDFDDQELEAARRAVVNTLTTAQDSQSRLENYWMGHAAANLTEPLEELASRVDHVTRDQVLAVGAGVGLDTIYFLKGKEG